MTEEFYDALKGLPASTKLQILRRALSLGKDVDPIVMLSLERQEAEDRERHAMHNLPERFDGIEN